MTGGNGKFAAGLALGAGFGIAFGYLLAPREDVAGLREGQEGGGVAAGSDAAALEAAKTESDRLAAEVAELKEKLALAGGAPAVVEKPADSPPLKPATEGKGGKTSDPKADWEATKKAAAAGKEKWAGKGKGGMGPAAEPPEGMTREQWDAAVRIIVEGHDWRESLAAVRRLGDAKRSGRAMEPEDLARWESLQETWRELNDLGVARDDPRVLRGTVPGRISALGANLNESQAAQLGTTVEELARREAARPAPDVPERFATATARRLRHVIALEDRMAQLLSAEQMQGYLAEVGDDPFASGWETKPWRMHVGTTVEEVAERALGHWSNHYGITELEPRDRLGAEAATFAAAAVAVAGPVAGMDAVQRRRAILERTARIAELQGEAEQRFLATGPGLSGDARAAALQRQAPVFLIDAP